MVVISYNQSYGQNKKNESSEASRSLPGHASIILYLADMYGIYKSYAPLLIKKTSFEVKHCKIETVFISRSAQAGKLKKTYI